MNSPRSVVVLGSTGSIGTQALDVARAAPDRFQVSAVCSAGDIELLAAQAAEFGVDTVGIATTDEETVDRLRDALRRHWPDAPDRPLPRVLTGPDMLAEVASLPADVILNAVDGAQGLRATVASLDAGRTIALANKESLIVGGPIVKAKAKPGQIVPVDSEHSAIAQCLRGGSADEVRRLVITASGGPFRGRTRAQLADVTPAQAMAHPTWQMGKLVTTNSATLVNKGLEVIEAHLLFDLPYERIAVVAHPQSMIHSMVEFVDGSTLAQASPPDMRLPIALGMGWPDRVPGAARPVDWAAAQTWVFEPIDEVTFPAIELAREAGLAGGCAPAVFNGANEELVAAFHAGRAGFLAIVDTIGAVLEQWLATQHAAAGNPTRVEDVEQAQQWARRRAREIIGGPA
ncbi:MAG: 1-deoxy-D-xylulose-5-phosphate reductoisomerase [Actinomycetia bacterium]|nr:1-deoxy-D-xylulose-5-phosphate reductoisomerase [Actinomycetes bacterium]